MVTRGNLLALLLLSCSTPIAQADQAQVISLEQAELAQYALQVGSEIRHHCAPCEDEFWRPEVVGAVEVVPFEGEDGLVEIKVNGQPIDLAYVYTYRQGHWGNLGPYAGAEVSDVPEKLNPLDVPQIEGFATTHFQGTIGEAEVLATLASGGERLSGVYRYAKHQSHIALSGSGGADGFEMKESVDAKETGTWKVKVTRSPFTIEGTWHSPDGATSMPIKLKAVAVTGYATRTTSANGMSGNIAARYPLFLEAGHPAAAVINEALRGSLDADMDRFRDDVERSASEDFAATMPDMPEYMRTWEMGIEDYALAYVGDRIFSMHHLLYEYTGGAHPNSMYPTITLIIEDGKARAAKLSDFLKEGEEHLKVLSDLIIADLKRQGATSVTDGGTTGFKPDELGNFTVSPAGMVFYFSPYAVGSYAEGMYKVVLSWKDLGEHGDTSRLR